MFASTADDFGDAISFIFESKVNNEGDRVGGDQVLDLLWEHLEVSGAALGIAILIAVPIGLVLGHLRKGELLAVSVANIGRAVPSFALIALFIAYLGVGFTNVMVALVLLAIPPILTNTYVGVSQVDRDVVDAARGIGHSERSIIGRIELPLALPLVFGGVRTSAVNVVATATIAPLGGLLTLGDPIINPTAYGDDGRLGAAILVASLAIATELVLALAQYLATPAALRRTRARHRPITRRVITQ